MKWLGTLLRKRPIPALRLTHTRCVRVTIRATGSIDLVGRSLVQVDKHPTVLHGNLVGAQRREARRLYRLAGPDIEGAEVQSTLDNVVLQDAVGEARSAEGAFIVGGIELAADVIDGDHVVADLEALRRAF